MMQQKLQTHLKSRLDAVLYSMDYALVARASRMTARRLQTRVLQVYP